MPARNTSWIDIFLQECEKDDISPREAIKKLSFACKLAATRKRKKPTESEIRGYIQCAMGKSKHVLAPPEPRKKAVSKKKKSAPGKESTGGQKTILSFTTEIENKNIH